MTPKKTLPKDLSPVWREGTTVVQRFQPLSRKRAHARGGPWRIRCLPKKKERDVFPPWQANIASRARRGDPGDTTDAGIFPPSGPANCMLPTSRKAFGQRLPPRKHRAAGRRNFPTPPRQMDSTSAIASLCGRLSRPSREINPPGRFSAAGSGDLNGRERTGSRGIGLSAPPNAADYPVIADGKYPCRQRGHRERPFRHRGEFPR